MRQASKKTGAGNKAFANNGPLAVRQSLKVIDKEKYKKYYGDQKDK